MATSILTRLGRRVRQLREAAGESQDDFAHRVGLGRAYYGRVEAGKVNVGVVNLERIARGLKVELWILFRFGAGKGSG